MDPHDDVNFMHLVIGHEKVSNMGISSPTKHNHYKAVNNCKRFIYLLKTSSFAGNHNKAKEFVKYFNQ